MTKLVINLDLGDLKSIHTEYMYDNIINIYCFLELNYFKQNGNTIQSE